FGVLTVAAMSQPARRMIRGTGGRHSISPTAFPEYATGLRCTGIPSPKMNFLLLVTRENRAFAGVSTCRSCRESRRLTCEWRVSSPIYPTLILDRMLEWNTSIHASAVAILTLDKSSEV